MNQQFKNSIIFSLFFPPKNVIILEYSLFFETLLKNILAHSERENSSSQSLANDQKYHILTDMLLICVV